MRGVTVDLLRDFAATLKVPLDMQVYDNSGQVTDAVASGACDLAFMPRDSAREAKVDFGPAYYFISSTYLVPAGSKIQSIDEVNRPGVRIVAISNTTTARSARRTAPQCLDRGSAERRSDDRNGAQRAGRCLRACRMIRLPACCRSCRARACCRAISSRPELPSRCPRAAPAALELASALIENAKKSGLVRRALDAAGFPDAEVAPPAA